ncbi:MAG TPA: hypothetical protein VKT30_07670 [Caulobacteraceae bacterium]|nr:hypothetical protein [Caulobacteraceae bacterium]
MRRILSLAPLLLLLAMVALVATLFAPAALAAPPTLKPALQPLIDGYDRRGPALTGATPTRSDRVATRVTPDYY